MAMPPGMMDAEIDGTPFNVLMQQAVKLKSHVHKIDRVKFDNWPKFYQNSVYVRDEQKAERALDYEGRMKVAKDYKAKADAFLKAGTDPLQASLNYEWALGLFKWATNTDPEWRKKSVDDNSIEEHEFNGEDEEAQAAIFAFKLSCYLNLSRAYFKQREFVTARQACDWALAMNSKCDKALLLRARALVEPVSHGATERDSAISDLEQAVDALEAEAACAASNTTLSDAEADAALTAVAKRKKEVAGFLAELRRSKREGKKADAKYAGLFTRGEVYDRDESDRSAKRAETERRLAEQAASGAQGPSPEQELAAAERLLADYEASGRTEEAEELRKGLDEARAKLDRARAEPPKMDFRKPTPEMIADAEQRGIDLTDPAVLDMLDELQRERDRGPNQQKAHDDALQLAEKMSMRDLIRELTNLGVDHDHCDTKDQLKDLFVLALQDQAVAKDYAARQPVANTQRPQSGTWRYTFAIATALVVYRLYSMNLIQPLFRSLAGLPTQPRDPGAAAEEDVFGHDATPGFFDSEDDEF